MSDENRNLIKDYFAAGIAMEEAREARERAREQLKQAAAVHCPSELRQLDAASEALEKAEQHIVGIMMTIMGGRGANAASTRQFAIDHAATCEVPNCPIKAMLANEKASAEADNKKLN